MIIRRAIWTVALLIGIVLAPGCKNPVAPTIHSVFPLGRLIAGETCKLKLICNVEAARQPVSSVTADLTPLGGAPKQELTRQPDGTWRWIGDAHPADKGLATLTVTATDNASIQKVFTKKIRVYVPSKAIAIAAGHWHTLALKSDGTVACWGRNVSGACDVPVGLADVVAIAGGYDFGFALKFDGTVACWGGGSESYFCQHTEDMADVAAIAADAVALKSDGTIIDPDCDYYDDCDITDNLHNVIAVTTGSGQRLAVKSDSTVACWGKKNDGECNVPLGLRNVVAVAGGYLHSLALKKDGDVVAWGGDGPALFTRLVPLGLGRLSAIATMGNVSTFVNLGLREDGTVVMWGRSRGGFRFTLFSAYENSIAINSGLYHYLALGEDGSVKAWGNNDYGQCDVPAELQ